MKIQNNLGFLVGLLSVCCFAACSSSSGIKKEIIGKYASKGENEYDNFKDTLEIRLLDDGKFDVQTIANWSAAKRDFPDRPNKNKKAGVWNSYGADKTEVAELQASDTTLRITEPITGEVKIIDIDLDNKKIQRTYRNGTKQVYTKVQ